MKPKQIKNMTESLSKRLMFVLWTLFCELELMSLDEIIDMCVENEFENDMEDYNDENL